MALTLIAAILVGLAAPFIKAWVWGVPFSLLSIATVLRAFVGSALTASLFGVAALFALRATPMDQATINRTAGAVGGGVALFLLLSSARRMRQVRGLSILCQRLQEEDARPAAARALERLFDRARGKNEQQYVALVLMATGPLTQAGMWAEARSRLHDLRKADLSEPQAVLRNQALATCELQFDDVEAAQHAIDQIRRPTENSIEIWLLAMEALVMAVRGQADQALAHLGNQEADDNPSLRASHRLVHVHVLAKQGNADAAIRELRALQQEAGLRGLERVVHPKGPASSLAEDMLREANQSG